MKYLVMLCDGMADEPLEELEGRTPLEAGGNTESGPSCTDFGNRDGAHCSERNGTRKRYGKSVGDRI